MSDHPEPTDASAPPPNVDLVSIIALIGGLYMIRMVWSGQYLTLVRQSSGRWLVLAGSLVTVCAISSLAGFGRAHDHGDGRKRLGVSVTSLLVVVPLILTSLRAPADLKSGAQNVRASTNAVADRSLDHGPIPLNDPVDAVTDITAENLLDRAAYRNGEGLDGVVLKVTGRIARGDNGDMTVVRFVMNCCAADAYPVEIHLGPSSLHIPEVDTWVELVGTYVEVRTENRNVSVVMAPSRIVAIEPPEEPYEIAART